MSSIDELLNLAKIETRNKNYVLASSYINIIKEKFNIKNDKLDIIHNRLRYICISKLKGCIDNDNELKYKYREITTMDKDLCIYGNILTPAVKEFIQLYISKIKKEQVECAIKREV